MSRHGSQTKKKEAMPLGMFHIFKEDCKLWARYQQQEL
jgi:hypothetical protein